MKVLIGHPTGNPNAHHAALAHFERSRLAAFCVSWMPAARTIEQLAKLPCLSRFAHRLSKRVFVPLQGAPLIQHRLSEWLRLGRRVLKADAFDAERLAYEVNDWLMAAMARAAAEPHVQIVHAFEDCALGGFEAAKRLGKACLYDLPIGFYPEWQSRKEKLALIYRDWLPSRGLPEEQFVRPEQKLREMELSDVILAPSDFVALTIRERTGKQVALARYGVDSQFWLPGTSRQHDESHSIKFLFAGHISLRKGIPFLLEAWKAADLKNAELHLVGQWQLALEKYRDLSRNVFIRDALSPEQLRLTYTGADVFVFPSFFDGYGLVINEALACGLPVIASSATGGPDVLDAYCGRVFESGNLDSLVEHLRWFAMNRPMLPEMSRAARKKAESLSWERYRGEVASAVDILC